jgi:hypothetical protein
VVVVEALVALVEAEVVEQVRPVVAVAQEFLDKEIQVVMVVIMDKPVEAVEKVLVEDTLLQASQVVTEVQEVLGQ